MLSLITTLGVFLIAVLHLWFLVLEMFLWQKPLGLKVFRIDAKFATKTASLAANQGLYNGFLAAGLIWSLFCSNPILAFQLKTFFLICVAIAGLFGGLTVSHRIFFIQAFPALLILLLLFIR